MILALCNPNDSAGLWACQELRRRGIQNLKIVAPEALVCAPRLLHRLGEDGVCTEVDLADGTTLRSDTLQSVFNRVVQLPVAHLARAPETDRRYAHEELTALYTSWLAALPCPVLNRATPTGLSGAWRTRSEWAALALRANLPIVPVVRRSDSAELSPQTVGRKHRALIVGQQIIAAPEIRPLASALRRLALLADTALLQVDFAETSAGFGFVAADTLPDFRGFGPAGIAALQTALEPS